MSKLGWTVTANVMEKIVKPTQDPNKKKLVLRVYDGGKELKDIGVSSETYAKAKDGTVITLNVEHGTWETNNSHGVWYKEADQF